MCFTAFGLHSIRSSSERQLGSKHLWTLYKKSQMTPDTVNQIWDVLLWELQALKMAACLWSMKKPSPWQRGGRPKAVEHMFHYACTGFHVVPKSHLLQHLPQHIRRSGVPRTFWVYSDESKNKQVKGLWGKVSKGWAMHEQVLERLMWLDALERL